jgi:hypothetical protein
MRVRVETIVEIRGKAIANVAIEFPRFSTVAPR